ncbi:MAG: hypothetical protein A2Y10_06175 [Planctomycetes bacterium GWF2_41_51]|nr:MAG: hypothetical protein A2Y10_06175 [Planctomycetes bacterium GWF2_41_51]
MIFVFALVANAADYAPHDNDVFWVGGTGTWRTWTNWSDPAPGQWYIPGVVATNPYNDGSWAYNGNNGRAIIQSGTAQITSTSQPDGQVYMTCVGSISGANLDILSTSGELKLWNTYVGPNAGYSGTINQSGGTVKLRGTTRIGGDGNGAYNLSGGSLTVGEKDVTIGNVSGSTGQLTISGGTLLQTGSTFYLGYYGTGVINQTGGDVTFDLLRMGYRSTGDGGNVYSISGGTFQHNKYLGIYNDSTFKVVGSGAESIRIMQLNSSGEGAGSKLAVELDSIGSTLIEVYGDPDNGDPYIGGADLSYVTLFIDTLVDFDGVIGETYDILWSATTINTTGMSLVCLSDTMFSWDVVDYNGGELLQLTVIPEPATIILLSAGYLVLAVKRKK